MGAFGANLPTRSLRLWLWCLPPLENVGVYARQMLGVLVCARRAFVCMEELNAFPLLAHGIMQRSGSAAAADGGWRPIRNSMMHETFQREHDKQQQLAMS